MQRGRKSAAAIAAQLNATGAEPRLTAPPCMTAAEKRMFNELITNCSTKHFRRTDIPLITSYIEASLLARSAARDPEQIRVWDKAIRLQCLLSTRLRLTPSARTDPKDIARNQPSPLRFPWENNEQHKARLAGEQKQEDDDDEE
jgi:hypothetical protein